MLAEEDKPRRGPTMCYKVLGRSEEERLEITLNEHGQPVRPEQLRAYPVFCLAAFCVLCSVTCLLSGRIGFRFSKALMKDVEEKHALEVQALQKDYEDKRQQDRREIANGLSSIISQLQQQNPQMSFDLSMFGSLFLDSQCDKDDNTAEMLQLHSSTSTSKVKTF
uniref:Uncharacterized protein n=1 Tax=Chenopodium quinoa TaxID=63459 RepID=A0A803N726_CHEQI